MLHMLNKENIKKLILGFLNVSLCIMILSSSLHLKEHSRNKNDGYTICAPGCEEDTHHSINENCERCINNRNHPKLFYNTPFYKYKNNKSRSIFGDVFVFNKYLVFSFNFSRPPPEKIA